MRQGAVSAGLLAGCLIGVASTLGFTTFMGGRSDLLCKDALERRVSAQSALMASFASMPDSEIRARALINAQAFASKNLATADYDIRRYCNTELAPTPTTEPSPTSAPRPAWAATATPAAR